MLAVARRYLGLEGRPNVLTRRFAARHGDVYLNAPWCDIAITEWARESGNGSAVLPDGDRAYTVYHAEDGRELGAWYAGTAANIRAHARPGSPIFFDWGGSNTIGNIDHVGVIEVNLGDGRVQTIEGNTGDACKRRIRGPGVIAGFWNPRYSSEPDPARKPPKTASWTEQLVKDLPTLKLGADNFDVKTLRGALFARGSVPEASYGGPSGLKTWLENTVYDADLIDDVKAFQRQRHLDDDGICGPLTWAAALRVA